ncbi:DUF177 domain-containing protein [soil metagenome]
MSEYHTIDLSRLALKSGEAKRLDLGLGRDELALAGQTYVVEHPAKARLDVSRTLSGYALRLRLGAELHGPCMRCLAPLTYVGRADSREIDQPSEADEELLSPYVEADILDAESWAHDALMLELPQALWCRPDCKGLCPVCGVSLNDAEPGHKHESEPDPRWSKLSELKLD